MYTWNYTQGNLNYILQEICETQNYITLFTYMLAHPHKKYILHLLQENMSIITNSDTFVYIYSQLLT